MNAFELMPEELKCPDLGLMDAFYRQEQTSLWERLAEMATEIHSAQQPDDYTIKIKTNVRIKK